MGRGMGLRSMRALFLAAAIAGAGGVRPRATPSHPPRRASAAATTIDFAEVANYAAPPLPAYFDETVAALDNSPASNPVDDRVATLGRVLFYDLRLSTNDRASCAACHQQTLRLHRSDALQQRDQHRRHHRFPRHAARQPALLATGHDVLGPARRQCRGAGEPSAAQPGRDGLGRARGRHRRPDPQDGGDGLLPGPVRLGIRQPDDHRAAHPAGARPVRARDGLARQSLGHRLCAGLLRPRRRTGRWTSTCRISRRRRIAAATCS